MKYKHTSLPERRECFLTVLLPPVAPRSHGLRRETVDEHFVDRVAGHADAEHLQTTVVSKTDLDAGGELGRPDAFEERLTRAAFGS